MHDLPYVVTATGCHETTLPLNKDGYGHVYRDGVQWRANRYVWTMTHGPIPEGMKVLHRCDNPPCINLDHLFLGTQADNMADKMAKGRWAGAGSYSPHHNAVKTHCIHGHEYTPENTILRPKQRECRACKQQRRHRTDRVTANA